LLIGFARSRLNKKTPARKTNLPPLDLCGYPLWFVYECFVRWVMSSYVALPDDGGIGNQDERLWQAMQNMLARYNRAVQTIVKEK
jgi:hypothetical protein